jgi:DNA-binding NarL/FixJ family response regulator
MRLLIVDDDARFRVLARRLLGSAPTADGAHGVTVVGEAADAAGARELASATRPDVVLVDVNLGAEDGRALAVELAARPSAPAVVLVSSDPDPGGHDLPYVAKTELAGMDLRSLARADG